MVLSAHQTKTAALVLSLTLFILAFFNAPSACMLQQGCGITGHLCYHFFHVNVFHAICNIWCLLALAFYYDIEDWELLLAFIIASTVPSVAMSSQPIVGASGVCFALMGIDYYKVARKRYYLSWIIPIVAVGFIIPGMAAMLHFYCFIIGITAALVYSLFKHEGNR
jgi:membrane associated rhomboid family serine protease